jgi:hypothetical protein
MVKRNNIAFVALPVPVSGDLFPRRCYGFVRRGNAGQIDRLVGISAQTEVENISSHESVNDTNYLISRII